RGGGFEPSHGPCHISLAVWDEPRSCVWEKTRGRRRPLTGESGTVAPGSRLWCVDVWGTGAGRQAPPAAPSHFEGALSAMALEIQSAMKRKIVARRLRAASRRRGSTTTWSS